MKHLLLGLFFSSTGVLAQSLLLTPSGIKDLIQTGRLWICDSSNQVRPCVSEAEKTTAATQFDSASMIKF